MAVVQETLWADALNHQGYLAQPLVEPEVLAKNLHRVAQMSAVSAQIGALLAPRHNRDEFLMETPELGLTNAEIRMAHPNSIVTGLYEPVRYPRDRKINPLVFVYKGETTLDLPGVRPWHEAVRFHAEDFRKLAHSAEALGNFAAANTLGANSIKTNADDRAERDRKSKSAVAKQMCSKIKAINEYDDSVEYQHDTLALFERSLRDNPPVLYRPENAQKLLMTTDLILRKIIETSNIGRRLSPEDSAKVMLGFTFNFYQRGANPVEANPIKLAYTRMGKEYLNAVRGKLDESRNACLNLFEKNKQFMKPEDREEAEAYLYDKFLTEIPA
jgi:hypothetical protein